MDARLDWKRWITRFFNLLGIIGLVLVGVFIYLNHWAAEDNLLHAYRLRLVLLFAVVFLLHGAYLFSDSLRHKRYVWMVFLILAPVPVYWLYYGYYSVVYLVARRGEKKRLAER